MIEQSGNLSTADAESFASQYDLGHIARLIAGAEIERCKLRVGCCDCCTKYDQKKSANCPFKYPSSVRRGYFVALFEKNGILNEFKARYGWDGSNGNRYLRLKAEHERITGINLLKT